MSIQNPRHPENVNRQAENVDYVSKQHGRAMEAQFDVRRALDRLLEEIGIGNIIEMTAMENRMAHHHASLAVEQVRAVEGMLLVSARRNQARK